MEVQRRRIAAAFGPTLSPRRAVYDGALPARRTETALPIELPKEARTAAIQSIERYFDEELQQRIGNIRPARC
ncbi:Uncharacterised protein [Xylophilus ampelinus]|nr:Uncharacterised protein [Xylophilus ampelinus]